MLLNGKDNVFEQIASNYKKLITTGVLKHGEYLPSCRDLARQMGINPNTVQKAYTLLEDEGYVTKVLKKGVYVSYQENDNINLDEFNNQVMILKSKGVNKDTIINAVEEIYRGSEND